MWSSLYQDYWWVVWIGGGIVALVVGWFLLCLLTARFERRHIRRLIPLEDEQGPASRSSTAAEIADAALPLGFFYVGAFRDGESNILKAQLDMYLSGDGKVMLVIPSMTAMLGYRLLTRTTEDVWLMSSEMSSGTDQSGLHLARFLPGCTFPQVLRYHHDRIDSYPADVVPFDPETLVDVMLEHDRLRAERAVELGLSRWVSYEQDSHTSSWRGAFKLARQMFFMGKALSQANQLAEYYKSGADGPTGP